jgi:hypothetical protein
LAFLLEVDYRRAAKEPSELGRMLSALLQKVEAERVAAKC